METYEEVNISNDDRHQHPDGNDWGQHPEHQEHQEAAHDGEYERIMQQINELMARAEDLRHQQRNQALRSILEQMHKYGLTIKDIQSRKIGRPAKRSSATSVPPKYIDPATGATWTGRGRKPTWVIRAIEGGKTLDDLRIAA